LVTHRFAHPGNDHWEKHFFALPPAPSGLPCSRMAVYLF
jgi:hypothetical protein